MREQSALVVPLQGRAIGRGRRVGRRCGEGGRLGRFGHGASAADLGPSRSARLGEPARRPTGRRRSTRYRSKTRPARSRRPSASPGPTGPSDGIDPGGGPSARRARADRTQSPAPSGPGRPPLFTFVRPRAEGEPAYAAPSPSEANSRRRAKPIPCAEQSQSPGAERTQFPLRRAKPIPRAERSQFPSAERSQFPAEAIPADRSQLTASAASPCASPEERCRNARRLAALHRIVQRTHLIIANRRRFVLRSAAGPAPAADRAALRIAPNCPA